MRRSILVWLIAILSSGAGISWGQTQTVPDIYSDLYTQLSGDLSTFSTTINHVWDGSTSPVIFAGQLTGANANNGERMLTPSAMADIQTQLLVLKAVGVQAVSVEVSFPMLYEPFLDSVQSGYQNQFTTFYASVAAAVRAQGFKLIVEIQSLDNGLTQLQSNQIISALPAFYEPGGKPMSFSSYIAARATAAATVVQTMKPDYVVLQEEPDTEEYNTGQPVGQVEGSTEMLNSTYAAVAGLVPGMKIGAGFGTWLGSYQLFANSFTQTACGVAQPCVTTPLDFLDIHLFPIIQNAIDCSPGNQCPSGSSNFQSNTMAVIETANAAGMHMTISQCWLRKVRDSEWMILNNGGAIEEAREAYSFWEPLDASFLQIVYDLANYQGMYWVAPFNTQNWSAYLTWSSSNAILDDCGSGSAPCGVLAPNVVFSDVQDAAATQVPLAQYTSTAQAWFNLAVSPAAIAVPSQPGALLATPCTASVSLAWNPSTDNVGVAGYQILRNGVQIATVFSTSYQDSGLADSTSYTYQVQAFNLASIVSKPATATVTTPAANQITICAVTNGASFTANILSPGAIATIFGNNLATSTAPAMAVPLPMTLGGATVTVNGIAAPLFFASSLQINFQVPNEVKVGTATVVVSIGSTSTAPFSTAVQTAAPGIFTFSTNRAAVRNPDESVNNSNNPVTAGSYIVAYLTGQGPVDNPVADGVPAPDSPLSHATSTYSATIGGLNANVFFLGLAPGYVGLAQANITVPSSLASGDYPLIITVNGVQSNGPLITVSAPTAP
jgi:uncharacterized protein (TIGR03437 family)